MASSNSHLIAQRNFSGGEIAPQQYGHTDSPAYQHGLRTALNFIPTLEGQLVNRPGTRYTVGVKDNAYAPRLIDFDFTDGQTFVLEIGDKYLRIIRNGVQLTNSAPAVWSALTDYSLSSEVLYGGVVYHSIQGNLIGGNLNHQPDISPTWWSGPLGASGGATELTTPWAIADVDKLKWSQDGDVITFTCVNGSTQYAPYEVARLSNTNWTVTAATFVPSAEVAPVVSPAALGQGGSASAFGSNWSNIVAYTVDQYVFDTIDGLPYIALRSSTGKQPSTNASYWALSIDANHPEKPFTYVVTTIYKDALGVVHEGAYDLQATSTITAPRFTDRPITIRWLITSVPSFNYKVLGYRIYGGRNGLFGLLGTTTGTTLTFKDEGLVPDYGTQPPQGTNPFTVADGANTANTYSYPGAFTYHDQRAIYARSNKKPSSMMGSALGELKRFDINTPKKHRDSFDFKPASERLEEIRSLLSLDRLLLLTSAGVWHAEGANDGAITATSILLRRSNKKGASYLRPLIAEEAALYQTNRGRIRDLQYDWRSRKYVGRDVSVVARHLFDGHTVTDWAYAETPYSVVWAVSNDGVLLSLTYGPGGIEAWARHTTTGCFERVCCVAETNSTTGTTEDAVYVVVKRIINGAVKRYIERFSSRLIPLTQTVSANDGTSTFRPDDRYCNFLDASLQYDGHSTGLMVASTTSDPALTSSDPADFGVGDQIYVTTAGIGAAQFTAAMVGTAQFVFDPDGTPVRGRIIQFISANKALIELDDAMTAAQVLQYISGSAVGGFAIAADIITGLDHLEGQTVNALVDGAPAGPFTVQGGSVTLSGAWVPGIVVQIGIPYNSDMELLDLAPDSVKTNQKVTIKPTFEVVETRGLLMGESFSNTQAAAKLYAPQLQKVSDENEVQPLFTGNAATPIAATWNQHGRACVRQSDPLPCTIVAVVREAVIAGR